MIRLRDPVTREAIIRPYTPISETSRPGELDVLIKLYLTTSPANPAAGKMSKAMSELPLNHPVEIKGPIGKFTYLGNGACDIRGQRRHVTRFIMICAGSGISPIFQVFRAVMRNTADTTHCTVLNGNRLPEDILCRSDFDQLMQGNKHKAQIIYTLTRPHAGWEGARGRIDKELVGRYCQRDDGGEGMVLVCGPEALERSVHVALGELGWRDVEILFF